MKQDGFTFDVGPSFFSMSYEFEELFRSVGMQNPLELVELNPLYAVNFAHHTEPFLIYKDLEKLAETFGKLEPDFIAKVKRYLAGAKSIFHDTEYRIVKKNLKGPLQHYGAMATVPLKHAPKLFRTMWQELSRHFEAEEVKIVFSLVAFFLGATPFDTPSVYSLLNYTELEHDGYWSVQGGMYRITEVLVEELQNRGAEFHFGREVTAVVAENGRVTSVTDQTGQRWQADIFVSNSDAAAFRGEVLGRQKFSKQKLDGLDWTLAPFTIYLGVEGKVASLHHHNYFLGSNFQQYASTIFKLSVNPEKPYYYVNVPSKSDPTCAPEGCENLFILCPVPDLRYKSDWSDSDALADTILTDLSARTGFDYIGNTRTRTVYSPAQWRDLFNLYQGSGLGLAHGLNQIGGLRPRNKDEEYGNLYYVGASTTPGTGLPIVVISSDLVTQRIFKDYPIALPV